MKKILFLILIFTLAGVISLVAQDISRVGTSAAQFLKLGVGARAAALGESAVTLQGEVTGLYWNPASIASIDRTTVGVSHNDLYADMSYNFVGVVQPLGSGSSFGVSVIYLDTGNMEITTLDDPEGTGSFFTWKAYCIGITYSRFVTDRLRLGGTVKYINEGAYHQTAQNIAIDLGSLLDTGVMGLKLGMALSNFGGDMRLSGPGLHDSVERWPNNPGALPTDAYLKTEKYPMPMLFRIGLSMELMGKNGQLMKSEKNSLFASVDVYDPNDSLMRSNMGVEYIWNSLLALRMGYRGVSVEEDEFDSYNTSSYTFGGGIAYDLNNLGCYNFDDFTLF